MDLAGASPPPHAVGGLLARAVLVALLAFALAPGSARAQVTAPPGEAPAQSAPGHGEQGRHHDRDQQDWDGDGAPAGGGHGGPQGDGAPAWRPPGADPVRGGDSDGSYNDPALDALPPVRSSYVPGRLARMRADGKAAIPRGAPKRVRALISQYNRIVGKRYKWGGGHARLADTGYDCSGAVGYGLIKGGMSRTTMTSGSFARWGAAGAGRWVTIYAHTSHVYIEIAGLRLDTSAVGDRGGRSGVRWRPVIGQRRGFRLRHPAGL